MRDPLVDAALALFYREGFSSLTMEGIAARLRVSKATLYKYFPNKDALLEAALELHFERNAAVAAGLDPDAPYPERLAAYLRHIEASIRPAAPILMRDILATTPWAWERIARFRREVVFAQLRTLLEEGHELGFLRTDLDAATVPALYTAIVDQVARPDFLLGWDIGLERLIDSVIQILLGGILSDDGRRRLREAGVPSDGRTEPAAGVGRPDQRATVVAPANGRRLGRRSGRRP
jgi:AcrR family transcriptional regulator